MYVCYIYMDVCSFRIHSLFLYFEILHTSQLNSLKHVLKIEDVLEVDDDRDAFASPIDFETDDLTDIADILQADVKENLELTFDQSIYIHM